DPVRDHVNRLKAAGARVEWRELVGLTHYNTGAFVPALTDAAGWLERSWRSAEHRRREGGQWQHTDVSWHTDESIQGMRQTTSTATACSRDCGSDRRFLLHPAVRADGLQSSRLHRSSVENLPILTRCRAGSLGFGG